MKAALQFLGPAGHNEPVSAEFAIRVEAGIDGDMLDFPWDTHLEDWPETLFIPLPRGISRHVVRFVQVGESIMAVKETNDEVAEREFRLLRDLEELEVPSVHGIGVVTGRHTPTGDRLPGALITEHLTWSMPYRNIYARRMQPDTVDRLLDALVLLLARLHLVGFAWNDCSLSNVLFRRDADAFAAWLVDAETGELHPQLSSGQRENDIEIAFTNIAGGLLDLQSGGRLPADLDPIAIAEEVPRRYAQLWDELTGAEHICGTERWRIARRVKRLNALGFDVAELDLRAKADGLVRIQPKVVDPGYHSGRLLRLVGLDVGENQARRLLNDLDQYTATNRAASPVRARRSEANAREDLLAAHRWMTDVYEPVIRAVPDELRSKLEDAQIFHEVLEHRWYLCERAGYDIGLQEAVDDYVTSVLQAKPNEEKLLTLNPDETGLIELDALGFDSEH